MNREIKQHLLWKETFRQMDAGKNGTRVRGWMDYYTHAALPVLSGQQESFRSEQR
ncbi:MAG: hypothetical protein IJI21_08610 [Clostridia bacterium]|nr:hypothetical protein [Clostridia bacterium]